MKIRILLLLGCLLFGVVFAIWVANRAPEAAISTEPIELPVVAGEIHALVDANFESVVAADEYLSDIGEGIAVFDAAVPRFYPFVILGWHLVAHDEIGGVPVAAVWDPYAGAAAVFDRRVADERLSFSYADAVRDGQLLFRDQESGSRWQVVGGTAIDGPRVGMRLARVPSVVTTWSAFKTKAPHGRVLSRRTGVERDYTFNPYKSFQDSNDLPFPFAHVDARLEAKTPVVGVASDRTVVAVTVADVKKKKSVRTQLEGQEVAFTWDEDLEAVRVDAPVTWLVQSAYWFAWASAFSETELIE